MMLQLIIKADAAYLRIDCPQVGWQRITHNSIAYDAVTKKLVAIGDDEAVARRDVANEPRLASVQLAVAQPLAIAAFDLTRALATIEYYARLVLFEARPMWQAMLWDVFTLDIWLDDYERLPLDQRQEFEFALKSLRLPARVRSVSVNGRSSLTSEYFKGKRRLQFQRGVAEWTLLLLFLGGMFGAVIASFRSAFESLVQAANNASNVVGLVLSVILLSGTILVVSVGADMVASFVYALLLRPWLPVSLLREVFEKQSHLFPKRIKGWLSATLFGNEPDGL